MTFGQSISTCLRKYVTFSGRASRSEFWWWYLFSILVNWAVQIVGTLVGETTIISLVVGLILLLPNLAVTVRRYHDSDHSGWWVVCPIYNIVLLFMKSTPGENKYGAEEA
jgi:uncharacterized membrane protein YhaH (DUF805 family)